MSKYLSGRGWLTDYPRALPLAIFLLIAAITILSVVAIERAEDQRRIAKLNETSQAVASTLELRSSAVGAYLRSGAALFSTLDEVTPPMFRRFVRELRITADDRATDGIGWAQAIPASGVEEFETRIGDATGSRYQVFPTPSIAGHRLAPVTFLQPLTVRNSRAIGFDMYSDPARAAAMDIATRTKSPAATAPVTLLQEGEEELRGFLVYMPVFRSGIGSNSGQLKGYIYSLYQGDAFLSAAVDEENVGEAAFRLYDDRVSPETLVANMPGDFTSGEMVEQPVTVAGRSMILQAEMVTTNSLTPLSMLTALFGLMVGSLLTVVVRLLTQQALEDQARVDMLEQQNSIRNTLTRELNHRVKNTLANVLSIVHLTRRRSENIDEFADGLDGRIRALSATHDLLTRSDWGTTQLCDVIEAELAPYRAEGGGVVEMDGPEVELAPNDALSLGLALHELATNAAKYGALSKPGGKVLVNWSKKDKRLVTIHWEERGGPAVSQKRVKGFGTDLIEKIVAHELRHPVKLKFDPAGVTCTLHVPMRAPGAFQIRADAARSKPRHSDF